MEKREKLIQNSSQKTWKKQLGRFKHRWENNITVELRETGFRLRTTLTRSVTIGALFKTIRVYEIGGNFLK